MAKKRAKKSKKDKKINAGVSAKTGKVSAAKSSVDLSPKESQDTRIFCYDGFILVEDHNRKLVDFHKKLKELGATSLRLESIKACFSNYYSTLDQLKKHPEEVRIKMIRKMRKTKNISVERVMQHLLAGLLLPLREGDDAQEVSAICTSWFYRLMNREEIISDVFLLAIAEHAMTTIVHYFSQIAQDKETGLAPLEDLDERFIALLRSLKEKKLLSSQELEVSRLDYQILTCFLEDKKVFNYWGDCVFACRDRGPDSLVYKDYIKEVVNVFLDAYLKEPGTYRGFLSNLILLSFAYSKDVFTHCLDMLLKYKSTHALNAWMGLVYAVFLTPMKIIPGAKKTTDVINPRVYKQFLLTYPKGETRDKVKLLIDFWVDNVFSGLQPYHGRMNKTYQKALSLKEQAYVPLKGPLLDSVEGAKSGADLYEFVDSILEGDSVIARLSQAFHLSWFPPLARAVTNGYMAQFLFHVMAGLSKFDHIYNICPPIEKYTSYSERKVAGKNRYILNFYAFLHYAFREGDTHLLAYLLGVVPIVEPAFISAVVALLINKKDGEQLCMLHEQLPPNSEARQIIYEQLLRQNSEVTHYIHPVGDDNVFVASYILPLRNQLTDYEQRIFDSVLMYTQEQGAVYIKGALGRYKKGGVAFEEPADIDLLVLTHAKELVEGERVEGIWGEYVTYGNVYPRIISNKKISQNRLRIGPLEIDIDVHYVPEGEEFEEYLASYLAHYSTDLHWPGKGIQCFLPDNLTDPKSGGTLYLTGIEPQCMVPMELARDAFLGPAASLPIKPIKYDTFKGSFRDWVRLLISQMKILFTWCQRYGAENQFVLKGLKIFFDFVERELAECKTDPIESTHWCQLVRPLEEASVYLPFIQWLSDPKLGQHSRQLLLCFIHAQQGRPNTIKAAVFDRRFSFIRSAMQSYVDRHETIDLSKDVAGC